MSWWKRGCSCGRQCLWKICGKLRVPSIMPKIPEISVGSQMERFLSVCSNRNILDHLLIGRTGRTENDLLTNRLISRFSSVDFSYIGKKGKGIEKGKGYSALGWAGVFGKFGTIILQLFQLVSSLGTKLIDSCSKWDASNAKWKFQLECSRFISTTFSRKTGSKTIQFKRPGFLLVNGKQPLRS